MKVNITAGPMSAEGTAPDDAPSMDEDFARVMLGVVCNEVKPDGSLGRSVDPQFVKADQRWIVGDRIAPEQREFIRHAARYWNAANPCEALASRDPGQVRA